MTTTWTADRIDRTTPDRTDRRSAPSLLTLTVVETRKLGDTRAGWWLLVVIGLVAAATVAIMLFAGEPADQTFAEFFGFGILPAAVLLPILGILSMTSEWSQRTALTTFALVPARGRVIFAKLAAAVLVSVAVTVLTLGLAAAGNLLTTGTDGAGSWRIDLAIVGQTALLLALQVLMGCGFGALLLNSPLAIVLFLVVPSTWSAVGALVGPLRTLGQWIDLSVTSQALSDPGVTAGEWSRLAASVAVWVALPLAAGTVRILRREVS